MDPHFQKLFSLGLGITEPWIIKSIDLVPSIKEPHRQEMRITVDFEPGARFSIDGRTGDYPVYDTKERTWRHLNFFQYRCYVTARVPRIKMNDGKILTVEVPWGRRGSGFTLLMEGVILSLVKHMAVNTVAKEIGEHDTKIWRVIEHHVETALEKQDFSDVTAIGVDEYSHKGHDYISVFMSHPKVEIDELGKRKVEEKARVLFVTEGKDKAAVTRFLERFIEKKGKPESVESCTSDMIHGFRNAMAEAFPNSLTTVDKFHVIKNMQDAVNNVRTREIRSKDKRKSSVLNKTRYLWLKNPDNLTESQSEKLEEILKLENIDTVTAYDYRIRLQDFYDSHHAYDKELLVDFEDLTLELCNSTIREISKFGELLCRNAVDILNYFITFKTNAILEGFNSKISIIKNRARGFKNMKNFMNMIYFVCGKLEIPFAQIM